MREFLFKKDIDQSLLKSGFTIPSQYHEMVLKDLNISLHKGENCTVHVIIRGKQYDATFTNVNLDPKFGERVTYQVRYSEGTPLCMTLKDIFAKSYATISEQVAAKSGRAKISVEDEFINVYAAGEKTLEFECITENSDHNSMLKKFYAYLGKENDLSGYQRSYKLVFYQCFFEHQTDGQIPVGELAAHFKEFYIDRLNKGKVPDVHVDRAISNPAGSSDEAILDLIFRNPFNAISKQGFFERNSKAGIDYFRINPDLFKEITLAEQEKILSVIDKKLSLYYSKIDGESKEGEPEVTTKNIIDSISSYISAAGFSYPQGMIENFYLSLKSKPFVILAGTSGTGKTRLVKLFAEAVGATSGDAGGNGRYKLVSVCPDWSDSSDLFGHVNLKGEFVPGAIIDFIKRASLDLGNPYFLCLDEMNLARVEYYLSDFLSVIETRRRINGEIVTDEILLDKAAEKKYGKVILPENLYIVGTVNMDETTFPFSKKVLDRANTIEFSYVELVPSFTGIAGKASAVPQSNEFLKTEYITLAADIAQEDQAYAVEVCEELQDINRILQIAQAHVGYRVRDEIVFYMLNNRHAGLLPNEAALDNEIMQKILPRIQGSSASVKNMMCELFKKFAGDYTGLSQVSVSEQMQAYIDSKSCKYRKSAEKICYMMRRFEEDGFTSYWL